MESEGRGEMKDARERSKEQVRLAALKIAKYIWWENSKKGFEYWNDVYEELMRIAETGEP